MKPTPKTANRRALNRRAFLTGAGTVAIGLPFLETLASRTAHAQTANPRRFAVFFECNGVNMERFFPVTPYGALTSASFTGTALESLSGYANKLLIPRGMHTVPKGFNFDGQTPDNPIIVATAVYIASDPD